MALAALALGLGAGKRLLTEPAGVTVDVASLRSGDILFLRGAGLLSRTVLEVDASSGYSHVGMVFCDGPIARVIHATPGDSIGSETEVRIELLAAVVARSRAAAVYRPRGEGTALGERAAAIARGYVREHRVFDGRFRLDTEQALYCTELVWRAYLEAGLDLVDGHFDEIAFPLLDRRPWLLPSRLRMSPHLQLVQRFDSKGRS